MTDTQRVVHALREAGKIIAAHLEPGHHRKAELALGELLPFWTRGSLGRHVSG